MSGGFACHVGLCSSPDHCHDAGACFSQPKPDPTLGSCAECGKTSTADSMWALYCVACCESKLVPALAARPDVARAFEIADDQMMVALRSYGQRPGLPTGSYRIPQEDEYGHDECAEAAEWLLSRGYVEREGEGHVVRVVREPGEQHG